MLQKLTKIKKLTTKQFFTRGLNLHQVESLNQFSDVNKHVFTEEKLKNSIDPTFYSEFKEAKKTGKALQKPTQDAIAQAMKNWALEKGCTTYTHWFSPLRGYNAEKYDSFIDKDSGGRVVVDFSGSKLFNGETDGSSFPTGGMRHTHTAAGFTSWDISSPPFIQDDCLYIPSAFIAWTGETLDEKTPLLRSNKAINDQSLRLLKLLGDTKSTEVHSNVGWEQEFFVIDRDNFLRRPDLVSTGRTLVGGLPSLGQQTEKHYFGKMPERVHDFLRDVQKELWRIGIAQFTIHNEVSPSQYEICPIYARSTLGSDQNTIAMEILHTYAIHHGLVCLLHEKPFAGINGSGKHNNWSLTTNLGDQLFSHGTTEFEQQRFIAFLSCVARAIHVHGDAIRIGISNAGNDHRLGAQEAPPAIISLYTGSLLEAHLREIIEKDSKISGYGSKKESLNFGTQSVLEMKKNIEDRNRTASFPLCANRFEFRAVGSSQNISWPLTMINATVSDSIAILCDKIEGGTSVNQSIKEMLSENMNVIFNGDGYSEEWKQEASKRKLWNLPHCIDALEQLDSPKNQELFQKSKIFTKHELEARKEILIDNYVKTMLIEVDCLIKMVSQDILPACIKDLKSIENSTSKLIKKTFQQKDVLYSSLEEENSKLISMFLEKYPKDEDLSIQGKYISNELKNQMNVVRDICDQIEKILPSKLYPYPNYEKILYEHHYI
eukprot:gene7829-12303_t